MSHRMTSAVVAMVGMVGVAPATHGAILECFTEYEATVNACHVLPPGVRYLCVTGANVTFADCVGTEIAQFFAGAIGNAAPAPIIPQGPGTVDTIDIELVALKLTSSDVIIEAHPADGTIPIPIVPIDEDEDGFTIPLDGDVLDFDDGYTVTMQLFEQGEFVAAGGFVVSPTPGAASTFAVAGLLAMRRRRRA